MMKRALALFGIFAIAVVMLYLSRFWIFSFWGRDGLFGIEELRPNGGLLRRWLRGTPFARFELLIWAVGVFIALTWLQKVVDLFKRDDAAEEDPH